MEVKSIAEHSAILLTFIKLPFVIKTFVLSIFEWPFYCLISLIRYFESVLLWKVSLEILDLGIIMNPFIHVITLTIC